MVSSISCTAWNMASSSRESAWASWSMDMRES
jgi:hypothetical protein